MSTEDENPDLLKTVEKSNELKEWLVDYVGNKCNPESDEVNVEMIIKVMAEDFPVLLQCGFHGPSLSPIYYTRKRNVAHQRRSLKRWNQSKTSNTDLRTDVGVKIWAP